MNERILELRTALGMSQSKFAQSVHLTQNFLCLVEKDNRHLSDRSIRDICEKHNVNETWLRTGAGEMFAPESREQKIAKLVANLYEGESNPHMLNIISVVSEMSDNQLEMLIDVAKKLAREEEKEQ